MPLNIGITKVYRYTYPPIPKATKAPTNEADGLPKFGTFSLKPIKNPLNPTHQRLRNTKSYAAWRHEVRDTLSSYCMLRLIDYDAVRPKPGDANEQNWFRSSFYVGKWLKNSIHREVLDGLEAKLGKSRLMLADEVYRAIERRFDGDYVFKDFTNFQQYRQLKDIKFYAPEDSIAELLRARKAMIKSGWSFPPYQAWIEIIVELQSELPTATERAMRKLQDSGANAKTFTEKDLNAGIRELV